MHLANTAAIKQYEGLKHSGDETDAQHLAHLLRLGILPTGTILPREHRAVRDLARKRMQLVQSCTAIRCNALLCLKDDGDSASQVR